MAYTNPQRQSVQWVGRAAAPPGMMAAQQRGPTVWNMCRLLSGNSIKQQNERRRYAWMPRRSKQIPAAGRNRGNSTLFLNWGLESPRNSRTRMSTLREPIAELAGETGRERDKRGSTAFFTAAGLFLRAR